MEYLDLYYSSQKLAYNHVASLLEENGFEIQRLYEHRLSTDSTWHIQEEAVIRVLHEDFEKATEFLVGMGFLMKRLREQKGLLGKLERFFTGGQAVYEYISISGNDLFYAAPAKDGLEKVSGEKIEEVDSHRLSDLLLNGLHGIKLVYCNDFDSDRQDYISVDQGVIFDFGNGGYITWLFEDINEGAAFPFYHLGYQRKISDIECEYRVVDARFFDICKKSQEESPSLEFDFYGQRQGEMLIPTDLEIKCGDRVIRICIVTEPTEESCKDIDLGHSNNWMVILEDSIADLAAFRIKKV